MIPTANHTVTDYFLLKFVLWDFHKRDGRTYRKTGVRTDHMCEKYIWSLPVVDRPSGSNKMDFTSSADSTISVAGMKDFNQALEIMYHSICQDRKPNSVITD